MATPVDKNDALITLDHITVRLRDRFLLEDTYWEIKKGEHWAVIGPNGAGKSTLTKAISGDAPVIKGRIIYHYLREDGHRVPSRLNSIARISFEQQRDWIQRDGHTPAAEVLRTALPSRKPSYDGQSTLNALARRLDLDYLLSRKLNTVSNGEARKLLIARALVRSPRLLILDEPFEGLDEPSRHLVKELIDRLTTGSTQVILVTHRFDEISNRIAHVLCLKDCAVYAQGSREEVLTPEIIRRIYDVEANSVLTDPILQEREKRAGADAEILIRMQDSTVQYGDTIVLDRVNWTMRRGENWAILGANGSGKSTLIGLITGENQQVYANDIYLFGMPRGAGESIWDIRSRLGTISSEFQIRYRKTITAHDVICSGFFDSIGIYRHCSREQCEIARNWAGFFRLDHLIEKRFDHLSYGQQRMVLLARAMVKSPELLILDDPCDGLDPVNREKILDVVERIGAETSTDIIYVTHRAREVLACMTHLMIMDKGRVTKQGAREQMESYLT